MTYLVWINALLCLLIAGRLVAFRREGATYRPWVSWLAYVIVVAAGSVPIRVLFGVPVPVDVSTVLINGLVCLALFSVRGNLMALFRADAHSLICQLLEGRRHARAASR